MAVMAVAVWWYITSVDVTDRSPIATAYLLHACAAVLIIDTLQCAPLSLQGLAKPLFWLL